MLKNRGGCVILVASRLSKALLVKDPAMKTVETEENSVGLN